MTDFSELGLSPQTLQAVADSGYLTATPIQAEAIPVALSGLDILGIAQTGTGKTAAFTLPMIERLANGRAKARMPRALVIEPTRELADQVASAFEKYAKGTKLTWALLIGGVSFGDQDKKIDRGVDVLIATPGRLLDHVERGKLLMTGVQIMVVDEADRMLDMGFIPDIERIFKLTPPKKQTLFFSATMPPEITRLTKQFLNDPVRIEASRPATTGENIAQHLVRIPSGDPKAKRMALRALIDASEIKNGIVFCNRKTEVDVVAKSLKAHGHDAAAIHGDLDQSVRTKTLEAFRKGDLKLLVASDVAARGLDIPDVSHVFNYDVPHHADDYVHRIGRTGRAGRSGDTFMIITPADGRSLDKVLKLIGKTPAETVLDLDWSLAAGGDEGRGGGARRGRSSRDSSSRESGRESGPRESAKRESAPDERAPGARSPRGVSRAERERRPKVEAEALAPEAVVHEIEALEPIAEAAPARAERASRREPPRREPPPAPRNAREDRDDDAGVRGFGSDTPAFLLRPIPAALVGKD
jgi:superfamily II DNA/RNA helicase